MSSLECKVEEVFQITGKGYVLTLNLGESNILLKNGDSLQIQDNELQEVIIKGIEMLNYGSNMKNMRKDIVGILVDISEDQALIIKGKTLLKTNKSD